MRAAARDQDGGEEVASNRAISEGDENRPPKGIALFAAAVGIAARYAQPPQRLLPRVQGILIRCTATQKMSVAGFSQPSRAGAMALPGPFCPVWLPLGIGVKHNASDYAPIRPFGLRIEQPQIGHEVLLII